MTASAPSPNVPQHHNRWLLWVDGGGGFLVCGGERWTVGGAGGQAPPAVCVQADWPRYAGRIERLAEDYFWAPAAGDRVWLRCGDRLPIPGSAQLRFQRPSPLSGSATLQLDAPHRFVGHVDGVVLFRDTLLIGPSRGHHIRCPHAQRTWVLTRRQERWWAKPLGESATTELVVGSRVNCDDVALTLELP